MKILRRIILPLLLLTLFTVYQVSIATMTHVHYVNGVMIRHSHPLNGEHNHTKSELLVIGYTAVDTTLPSFAPISFTPVRPVFYTPYAEQRSVFYTACHLVVLSLRAPPVTLTTLV